MRLAKIVGVASALSVMSSMMLLDGVRADMRADTSAAVHSRTLSAIERDYGQEGTEAYWESQAAQSEPQTSAVAPAEEVSVATEPPVQRSTGWFGRAGGFDGSDRVDKLGDQGRSAGGSLPLITEQPEKRYGRAGVSLLPSAVN
jgi:hypothetical protein